MTISLMRETEAEETSLMIERACRLSSLVDFYPPGEVENLVKSMNPDFIRQRSSWTHFYVMKDGEKIIGCGAIGPYWNSQTESCLFTIFIDPEYQKKGLGRKLVEALENDEFGRRAGTLYVHAAMSALPFYKKVGFSHKGGVFCYDSGHFELEKKKA